MLEIMNKIHRTIMFKLLPKPIGVKLKNYLSKRDLPILLTFANKKGNGNGYPTNIVMFVAETILLKDAPTNIALSVNRLNTFKSFVKIDGKFDF